MPISLPNEPDGKQFEDFVSASLLALGYFTESRMILKEEGREILELDVVATPLGGGPGERILIEAKKNGFSFAVVFKVFGQRHYLRIPHGIIVSLLPCDPDIERIYHSRSSEMDIRICHLPSDVSRLEDLAESRTHINDELRSTVAQSSWYGKIAQRVAYSRFLQRCRQEHDSGTHRLAKTYLNAVHDAFFLPDPLDRASALYQAYLSSPRLSGKLIDETAQARGVQARTIFYQVGNSSRHFWLQYFMFLESQSRIVILKNALDDILVRGTSPLETQVIEIGGHRIEWPLVNLPPRFVSGLDTLRDHDFGAKIPYLFQVFTELFGGFVFENDGDDLQLIARVVDIPADRVLECLNLVDDFFAREGETFFYRIQGELLCMKMIPAFLRGVGCFVRHTAFQIEEGYQERFPVSCVPALSSWHNSLYFLLEPELAVETDHDT